MSLRGRQAGMSLRGRQAGMSVRGRQAGMSLRGRRVTPLSMSPFSADTLIEAPNRAR
jgi:hypothetical protein